MISEKQILGKWGENLAASYLCSKGFSIICRNYATKFGEIDLVARDRDYLVFVEVRTKKDVVFGSPLETINKKKRNQMIRMAKIYFALNNLSDSTFCRFDVIGIIPGQNDSHEIIHIQDAFQT